jgi:hypothetical protein
MLKFIREHPLVPSWKARLPCCCFPLFCILASYLSCSRSQVGIDLGFPVIIFKYHPKWHCILFWCKFFKEATRNLTPLSVFWMFVFFKWRARDTSCRGGSQRKNCIVTWFFSERASWKFIQPANLWSVFGQTNRNSGYFFLE